MAQDIPASEILGALPLIEVNSWLTGKRGICLPFTDECDALGTADVRKRLIEAALEEGKRRGWKYFEIRASQSDLQLKGFEQPSVQFHGHRLDLTVEPEKLFAKFDSSVRRAIRKAERSGLEIEVSTDEQSIKTYYALHCKTRQKHGIPPQPLRFFLNLQKRLLSHKLGMVVTAKHNGKPIASAVFLHDGDEALYKFGASEPAVLDLRANNLVMWKAIETLANAGRRILDFGRTSIGQDGLRRFKLGWGADEYAIRYHRYNYAIQRCVSVGDDSSGKHSGIFSRLPPTANRCIGAMLYKHVA